MSGLPTTRDPVTTARSFHKEPAKNGGTASNRGGHHSDHGAPRHDGSAPKSRAALNAKLYVRLCRAGDLVIAPLVLVGAFLITNTNRLPQEMTQFLEVRFSVKNMLILIAFVTFWRVLASASGLYDWPQIRRPTDELGRVLAACVFVGLLVLSFPLLSDSGAFGFHTAVLFWAALVAGLMGGRLLFRVASAAPAARDLRDVLNIGSGPRALQVFRELEEEPSAFQVVGFLDTNADLIDQDITTRMLGTLGDLEQVLMSRPIDDVLITLPVRSHYAEIQQVIDVCEGVGVPSRHMADVFRASRPWKSREEIHRGYMQTAPVGPQGYKFWIKRGMDAIIGLIALIVLSPVMLAAALAVKLSGPGPIIFSQSRYGLNRRPFRMYKFRTMVADAEARQEALEDRNEAAGPVFKIKDDPRVTPVGRFLRRTSIDELPQLVNVVLGDMSLVGPRPLPARDVQRFNEATLMRRFSVRPGLTCLWQIGGRSNVDFARWIALDLKYIDEWSLRLDVVILARTVPVVFRGEGAV
jgi:exopolysaccharide biosynthesis polyprenyl glycosylphosphotransferase